MSEFNEEMGRMLRLYFKTNTELEDTEVKEAITEYNCLDSWDLHQELFLKLYNLMKKRLKKVIKDVTYIYPERIKRQKYYKIYTIEKRLGITICMAALMEDYREEYIREVYSTDFNRFTNYKFELTLPFWEFLQSLNYKKIQEDIKRLRISYSKYLALKFCDMYWLYIEKCLRRDFSARRFKFETLEYVDTNSTTCQNDFSYNVDFDSAIYISKIVAELEKNLTTREKQVWKLLFAGYSHTEISSRLGISTENSMRIKSMIAKKFYSIITEMQKEY